MRSSFAVFLGLFVLTACAGAPATIPTPLGEPKFFGTSVPVIGVEPAPPKVVSPMFKEQTARFIEMGSKLVASAQYETLESFGLQVGALSAVLGLMVDTGQDAMPANARANADIAIHFWQETAKGWELRSRRIVMVPSPFTNGRPRAESRSNGAMRFSDAKTSALLESLATAAKAFEAAKREFLELIK